MSIPVATGSKPAAVPTIQEFSIRVPKNSRKRHNVMRFNGNLNVDISKWTQVKMERENNAREYKGYDEEMPKFGAGSEFGRDAREEARRKKFGITARKYKPENQPWILKTDGKAGKKFKGIREGGIGENAAYYVFTHAPDGAIEAFPLHEWYNFQPIQRYKTLTFEEVEDELKRRVKRMSRWSLMEKRLNKKDDDPNDEEPENVETTEKKGKQSRPELKISDLDDDWMNSDDDTSDSDEEGGKKKKKASDEDNDDKDDDKKKKKKKQPIKKKKKKKKRDSDDEAFEESDDGDEEGRECEYLTDSTDSEDEAQSKEVQSVAEEDALRKALASDEDDEDENDEEKKDDDEFEEDEAKNEKDKAKDTEKKKDKKKKKPKKKDVKKNSKDSSLSEGSSDLDSDSDSPKDSKEINGKKINSAHNSRSSTPTVVAGCSTDKLKRKGAVSPDLSVVKKIKTETPAPAPAQIPTTPISGSNEGITEEAVRRYLMRKPMTTTELLQKFKSKKTGITSDKLVVMMTQILKKINPTRQTIKNKMYLSLKVQPH